MATAPLTEYERRIKIFYQVLKSDEKLLVNELNHEILNLLYDRAWELVHEEQVISSEDNRKSELKRIVDAKNQITRQLTTTKFTGLTPSQLKRKIATVRKFKNALKFMTPDGERQGFLEAEDLFWSYDRLYRIIFSLRNGSREDNERERLIKAYSYVFQVDLMPMLLEEEWYQKFRPMEA